MPTGNALAVIRSSITIPPRPKKSGDLNTITYWTGAGNVNTPPAATNLAPDKDTISYANILRYDKFNKTIHAICNYLIVVSNKNISTTYRIYADTQIDIKTARIIKNTEITRYTTTPKATTYFSGVKYFDQQYGDICISNNLAIYLGEPTNVIGYFNTIGNISSLRTASIQPIRILLNSKNELIVVDTTQIRIFKFNGDSEVITTRKSNIYCTVTLDSNDNIYMYDGVIFKIIKITPNGTVTEIADIPDHATSIICDNEDNILYITNKTVNSNNIQYISKLIIGGTPTEFGNFQAMLVHPISMCFDSLGCLYVANDDYYPNNGTTRSIHSNRIYKIS